jgi:sigma-B regulation protein RsbU (phosphoserine phosphatase)
MSEKKDEIIQRLEHELKMALSELSLYKTKIKTLNIELEKVISEVGRDLQMALKIQKMLSPTEPPKVSGFEMSSKFIPGMKKGGNYFDVFEHQDKLKFSVLMSSCSGFNISSLLLSVLIKMTSMIEARKGTLPHVLIQQIFQELQPLMTPQEEASIFYGIIDKRNYKFEYCQVGKFYAYQQIYGRDVLHSLEPCASALSKSFNTELHSKSVSLSSKDRLILVSEGILQNQNQGQKSWTESDLMESIKAAPKKGVHELRNEILFQNERFLGTDVLDYDVTVLITEVKDTVIKLATE